MRRLLATAAFAASVMAFAPSSHATLLYGSNVIINGDAEADVGNAGTSFVSPSGWTNSSASDGITVVTYGPSGGNPLSYPLVTSPGPANRGVNFFGGTISNQLAYITQTLDVSNAAAAIDAGLVTYNVSAYLGGFYDQEDQAKFQVTFLDGSNAAISTVTLGPVTQEDRGGLNGVTPGVTELLLRASSDVIPDNTRALLFTLTATRYFGTNDDGYADNLSFVANGPSDVTVTPLPAALPLFAGGIGAIGMVARRVRRKVSIVA
jgi:hypothetical protein